MTRGGKREGAGRPKGTTKEPTVSLQRRVKPEWIPLIDEFIAKLKDKKLIILLFCLIFLALPCFALTLEGGVTYTEETARVEAFEGVSKYLTFPNKESFRRSLFLAQINYDNVFAAAEFKSKLYGIIPYKTLCVIYKDDTNRKYYYEKTSKGFKCVAIDIQIVSENYPIKTVKYLANTGSLLSIIYSVSPYEDFVFDADGNLIEHWIKNNAKITYGKRQIKYFGQ